MSKFSDRNPYATQTKTLPARGFGGLNEFYLRNNYGGTREGIDRAANEARRSGELVGADGVRRDDTWENRGMGHSQSRQFVAPQGPTPDQMRWEQAARAKAEADAQAAAEQLPVQDTMEGAMNGSGLSAPSRAARANPYTPNFSRAGNIANAKAAGEFDQIRQDYNAANAERGMTMDEGGVIRTDPEQQRAFARGQLQPIADEIAAQRDFNRGEAPVSFTPNPNDPNADEMAVVRAEKINPYGTATATYGGDRKPSTMVDPMGRTVPMSSYLADQSAVQDSKFGKMMQNGTRGPQEDYKFGAAATAPAPAGVTPMAGPQSGGRFGQMMSARAAAGEDGGALGAKDAQAFKNVANGGGGAVADTEQGAMADAGEAADTGGGEVADTGEPDEGGGDGGGGGEQPQKQPEEDFFGLKRQKAMMTSGLPLLPRPGAFARRMA